jgi:hypothetical protein
VCGHGVVATELGDRHSTPLPLINHALAHRRRYDEWRSFRRLLALAVLGPVTIPSQHHQRPRT